MKRWVQLISLFICSAMIIGLVIGCGANNPAPTQPASEATSATTARETEAATAGAETDVLEWTQDTSPVDISYMVNFSWFGLNWTDPTAKRITEKTGVNLIFSKPVADDNQKLNMMIAGNSLPEMLTLDKNSPSLQTMINSGMLWSYDELIDKYAPKMKTILDEEILSNYKAADGKTYQFTTWVQGKNWLKEATKYNQLIGTNQSIFTVRKDYYDEIGRPDMSTPEAFIEGLAKMKANHPDKIAFYPADGSVSANTFSPDLNNVGIQFGLNGTRRLVDGSIKWAVRDPKFLEVVKFLNALYAKGLLTKDPFIDSKDIGNSKISKGNVICYSWAIGDGEKIPDDNKNTTFEILKPFSTYKQTRTGTGWLATVITKNAKTPDRAIKFMEYLASREGHQDVSWGIEGDAYSGDVVTGPHWQMVNGKPTLLPKYKEAKNADWEGTASKNGLGEYWLACNEELWNLVWWDETDTKMAEFNKVYGSLVEFKPEMDIQDPDPASDLGITLQKAKDLLKTASVKMIFAKDVDSEYNNFISQLDALGMQKVEEAWNNAYNTHLKNIGK